MAHPQVRFALTGDNLAGLEFAACPQGPEGLLTRISQVLGAEFRDNALEVDAEREGVRMKEIPVRVLEKRVPTIGLFRRVPNVLKAVDRRVAGDLRPAEIGRAHV